MSISDLVAMAAALIACLSAIYSRRAWRENKRANDIAQINTLLELHRHYSDRLQLELDKAGKWQEAKGSNESDGFTKKCQEAAADYDQKVRDIKQQLENLNSSVVDVKT